jgi:hypothetical protein
VLVALSTSSLLATQEAEIRRTVVQSQPGQIVLQILFRKKPITKRAGGVAQGIGVVPKNNNNKVISN